jgi:hypothetical protein
LTVFEIFFADGLEAGLSAKRGGLENSVPRAPGRGRRQRRFFYFFENNLCREPLAEAVGKYGFSIFFKHLCREPLSQAVGKDDFLFFFENTCAESPWQRPSAKKVFLFF